MDAKVEAATETRTGMPLGARMFLLGAFLVLLAVGAAVAVTLVVGLRIADEQASAALIKASEAQARLADRRQRELELATELIGNDAALVSYVASALGDDLGLGFADGPDTVSIRDLLLERQGQFGFDLGMVLDIEARLVARTDAVEAFALELAGDPLVGTALGQLQPISGFWRFEADLYQAAVMPLVRDGSLVGFLVLAGMVDDAFCREIADVSGSDFAYWLPGTDVPVLAASSLSESRAVRLERLIVSDPRLVRALQEGSGIDRYDLELDDAHWLVRFRPTVSNAPDLGAHTALASRDAAAAGYREILRLLVLAGLGSLLLALPVSLGLSRRILRPVRALADAAERAASGDYRTRIAAPGSDEIGRLGGALDSLLSDLREKTDMERYVATFARFGDDAKPAPPPQRSREPRVLEGLFLGIEVAPEGQGRDGMRHAATHVGDLALLAGQCEGHLVVGDGSRYVLSFEGDDRLARALAAVRAVLGELPASVAPAMALAEGEAASGDLVAGSLRFAAVVGSPAFLLHRLLSEAPPGRVLLAPNLVSAVTARFGDDAVERVRGVLGGQPRRALSLAVVGTAERPAAASSATQDPGSTVLSMPSAPVVSSDLLAPNEQLGGRYQIIETLGAGGMGVVYKARDLELDEVVAIKMLRPRALADGEHLERLKDEIRLARRITHPNVLRTFDFGEAQGRPFISMEYVRGMTLRTLLERSDRVPFAVALRIARQLCAGLAAAHAEGVLHRDLKPENLILEPGGTAKLMDFGIARPARRLDAGHTTPGTYVGTPAYSPAEQLAGEEVDERADIFAVGVLLSELFCGGLPFVGRNPMELYMAHMQDQPRRPSELWPDVPARLEEIILRCLRRDPAERFQSAAELGAALAELRA
ncbi:MAG TPA: protein kinase [Xanthomonadaceae bacterium]|nr:protein kinase [Xanthomonadaceae bacterium]